MALAAELHEQVAVLAALLGEDASAAELAEAVRCRDDDEVLAILRASAALTRSAERVRIVASGEVAARSAREAGHEGLAQRHGHRSPVSLVQEVTGSSRTEAVTQIRVGAAVVGSTLFGAAAVGAMTPEGPVSRTDEGSDAREIRAQSREWHACLSTALLAGSLSKDQHVAILRGLGEPPVPAGIAGAKTAGAIADEARAAWALAAEQLADEAPSRTVEELRRLARTIRDQLDPEGAARRFQDEYERRSLRMWTDVDGTAHARLDFDRESFAWVSAILDAALRPRRGGPRFVDAEEQQAADDLIADPRSNEQLAYDLLIDVLRAGALAEPRAVFGTRQAGVRLVQVVSPEGTSTPTGHTEDGLIALPAATVEQRICDSATTAVTVDRCGNPLDVGREHRRFTPRQRVALAVRDGGCRWNGCDRPASYCEAHHIDPFAEGGRTDIDRGILLCRYHHMALHHGGWRITRDGTCEFVLHPPPGRGAPIALTQRLALRRAWAGIDPPPKRFRPAA